MSVLDELPFRRDEEVELGLGLVASVERTAFGVIVSVLEIAPVRLS